MHTSNLSAQQTDNQYNMAYIYPLSKSKRIKLSTIITCILIAQNNSCRQEKIIINTKTKASL